MFAGKCGTSPGYLFKAIAIKSKLGAALSVRIEKHSGGEVSRKDLHPDDWADIWPEMARRRMPVCPALDFHDAA